MTLMEVKVDLKRVAEALESLVEILNRAFPPPEEAFAPPPLTEEERNALGFIQRDDAQTWADEVQRRREMGESDEDINWRAYAPRS